MAQRDAIEGNTGMHFTWEMMMRFQLMPVAVLSLAACSAGVSNRATAPAPAFTSDRISVVTTGTGPDIVLIPGLASHRDSWQWVAPTLDDNYRVHRVQLNGFAGFEAQGNSQGPILEPVTNEIVRYIRESRLDRPALIGHSMGGTLAMMLAARNPGVAGRVMVVDMMPFMGTLFGGPTATAETVRPMADQMRGMFLQGPQMLEQMFSTMTRNDSARTMIVAQARASNMRTVADAFHELIVLDLRPELPRIGVPLTVLYVVPAETPVPADQYEAALRQTYANAPGARIMKIDQSNHFIQIDQPQRLVAEVRTFMR